MNAAEPMPWLELWGGIECTVNRVGDRYFDQVERSGHAGRPEDLERIAALGIGTLRYPVLWERVVRSPSDPDDWSWSDARLGRLRQLGINPIAGLVHHGSGPPWTSLLDPGFADGLADFAGRVARRYPWVRDYTPVNEPLTTARFSGLYGFWYPHRCDGLSFLRALLNQCRAVVLAMRAVRRVRPEARLVQTEDLGKVHSTPALRYQADFENERRWLTFDLLSGRVDRNHPMASYFRFVGVQDEEWGWFRDNPCPPDLLGVNHYLTSERFLDERVERYPPCFRGGNGRHTYADVEAVRVCAALAGMEKLLGEVWDRYHLPMAVTEVHLGCTREEQMRWLWEVWRCALAARRKGVGLRAVTVWSLLGAFNWDSLVTQDRGTYEPGAFDLRGPTPRATALSALARQLTLGEEPTHPILGVPGWWHRPERLSYPVEGDPTQEPVPACQGLPRARPLLIVGSNSFGQTFARVCTARGVPFQMLGPGNTSLKDRASLELALAEYEPWAVVNAGGYLRVNDAEKEPEACRLANALLPAFLAEGCAHRGLPLLTFSSHLVFDGQQRRPFVERDRVGPLSTYGRSKAEGEQLVRERHPGALIVRAGAFFGPWDEANFVARALRILGVRGRLATADDVVVSPTYLPDLVHASLDLLLDGESGVWHVANRGEATWAELACQAARRAGLDPGGVEGRPASTFGWPAPRPAYSALGSERGLLLPHFEDALGRFLAERPPCPEPGCLPQITQSESSTLSLAE